MPYEDYRDEGQKKKTKKSPVVKRSKPPLFYAMILVGLLWGLLVSADGGVITYFGALAVHGNLEEIRAWVILGVGVLTILLGLSIIWGAYFLWRRVAGGRLLIMGPSGIILIRSVGAFCSTMCASVGNLQLPFAAMIHAGVSLVLVLAITGFLLYASNNERVMRILKE
jgi:hypothetical protein